MPITITDYADVTAKIAELGCLPLGADVTLLPLNFDSASSIGDLRHASETSTIRKLLIQENLPFRDLVERGQRPPYIKNKSSDLILPTLYFSAILLSQNPLLVSIALNVISNYVYDCFRGRGVGHTVKLHIVVEDAKEGKYRQIAYEGPEKGLSMLPNAIREAIK
jgi:hypothetical protein